MRTSGDGTLANTPALVAPHHAETRYLAGHRFDWRLRGEATGGALLLVETVVPAGGEPPRHVHEHEDEVFYVLEGDVSFSAGELELRGGPGTVAWLPRGVPHSFRVDSERARLLVLMTPPGAERFFYPAGSPSPDAPPPDRAAIAAGLRSVGISVVAAG